jgi:hypothetical protein
LRSSGIRWWRRMQEEGDSIFSSVFFLQMLRSGFQSWAAAALRRWCCRSFWSISSLKEFHSEAWSDRATCSRRGEFLVGRRRRQLCCCWRWQQQAWTESCSTSTQPIDFQLPEIGLPSLVQLEGWSASRNVNHGLRYKTLKAGVVNLGRLLPWR